MSSEGTGIGWRREEGEGSYRRVVTGKRSSESAGLLRKTLSPLLFSFCLSPLLRRGSSLLPRRDAYRMRGRDEITPTRAPAPLGTRCGAEPRFRFRVNPMTSPAIGDRRRGAPKERERERQREREIFDEIRSQSERLEGQEASNPQSRETASGFPFNRSFATITG